MKILFFYFIVTFGLSSASLFTPFRVLPPFPAVVSGILSEPSAARYGPLAVAPGKYRLFVEWITPGIWKESSLSFTFADKSRSFTNPLNSATDPPMCYTCIVFGPPAWAIASSRVIIPKPEADKVQLLDYEFLLGHDYGTNLDDGRWEGTPGTAEVRFWLFDEAQYPGGVDGARQWAAAAASNADQARQALQLPATVAPGAQTGIDVLLAAGLARLP